MLSSLMNALSTLDGAILKYLSPNKFEVIHCPKEWFYALAPQAEENQVFSFSQDNAYLIDFFVDAEQFWKEGENGSIKSGMWSEQTSFSLLNLEAEAKVANQECFLFINNIKVEFESRQQTLQKAREVLLSNDKILAEHDYLHERLLSTLQESDYINRLHSPLNSVFGHTDVGVCVLDVEWNLMTQNPAACRIFNLKEDTNNIRPSKIIKTLLQSQAPAIERVYATGGTWNGELFWLQPPSQSKWLQLDIHPVKNRDQLVKNWLFMFSDISRLKYLVENNEKLALLDMLTGLPNRFHFWQTLDATIEEAEPFFLFHLDIKNFKRINESYGHHAGDELILELVERIKRLVKSGDFFARIGGNEFAIISKRCSGQQLAETYAQHLLFTVEDAFYIHQNKRCDIGLSIGATHMPADASKIDDLVKFADMACYAARKENKSNVQFYSHALKDESRKRIELESAMREAIANQEFELLLQPILDLESLEIAKAEALIRWNRPDIGTLTPDEFVPVAEQTGLIVPIGKWVIKQSLTYLEELSILGYDIKMAINLSPKQVCDTHLLSFIRSAVSNSIIKPEQLELELTEGVLVENYERVQELLQELRKMGITISIDDFGTGYSSLSYLQKLPIDNLKIDRSFVQDLDTNDGDKAIVTAVIAMARSLNLGVIAEGVEKDSQKEFLQDSHCDTAQGFLFSRPLPFDEFCHLIARKNHSF